jgi:SAM-dependent methyltransferase
MSYRSKSGGDSLLQRLSREIRRRLRRRPRVGLVDFGELRRLTPISKSWGADRGGPVDRFYIDRFLRRWAADIHGRVLEVGTDRYAKSFGAERVTHVDVLHVAERKPAVTIIGDLQTGDGLSPESFDCVILTQTLQCIFDVGGALRTAERILVPGGSLLITAPGISKISRYDMDRWGYYWSFTSASMARLIAAAFRDAEVEIESPGNVLSAIAFLHGLGAAELCDDELEHDDPDYPVLVTARVRKAGPAG